jgi:competence protein ComEC
MGNIILLPMYTVLVIAGNLALIFIKVKSLFHLTCKFINFILIAVDGAAYLLLKVTPPVADISYTGSLSMLIIILCFILTKRGYEKFKFVPIFVIGAVLMQNYYFFPEIDYVNLGGRDGVIINYKDEKVLIHNLGHDFKEADNSGFAKVISNFGDQITFRLGKNYNIKILPEKQQEGKSINLEIIAFKRKTVLTRNTEDFMDVDLKKYDIIRLPKLGYYPFKGKITKKLPHTSYAIVFKKVYALN